MAESSSGPADTRRQLAEASAVLAAAGNRRAAHGSSPPAQIQTLGRVVSRFQPHATQPATTPLSTPDTQGLSDQDICRRLQAQRVALSLLGRNLPVPQQLLHQVGPASSDLSGVPLQRNASGVQGHIGSGREETLSDCQLLGEIFSNDWSFLQTSPHVWDTCLPQQHEQPQQQQQQQQHAIESLRGPTAALCEDSLVSGTHSGPPSSSQAEEPVPSTQALPQSEADARDLSSPPEGATPRPSMAADTAEEHVSDAVTNLPATSDGTGQPEPRISYRPSSRGIAAGLREPPEPMDLDTAAGPNPFAAPVPTDGADSGEPVALRPRGSETSLQEDVMLSEDDLIPLAALSTKKGARPGHADVRQLAEAALSQAPALMVAYTTAAAAAGQMSNGAASDDGMPSATLPQHAEPPGASPIPAHDNSGFQFAGNAKPTPSQPASEAQQNPAAATGHAGQSKLQQPVYHYPAQPATEADGEVSLKPSGTIIQPAACCQQSPSAPRTRSPASSPPAKQASSQLHSSGASPILRPNQSGGPLGSLPLPLHGPAVPPELFDSLIGRSPPTATRAMSPTMSSQYAGQFGARKLHPHSPQAAGLSHVQADLLPASGMPAAAAPMDGRFLDGQNASSNTLPGQVQKQPQAHAELAADHERASPDDHTATCGAASAETIAEQDAHQLQPAETHMLPQLASVGATAAQQRQSDLSRPSSNDALPTLPLTAAAGTQPSPATVMRMAPPGSSERTDAMGQIHAEEPGSQPLVPMAPTSGAGPTAAPALGHRHASMQLAQAAATAVAAASPVPELPMRPNSRQQQQQPHMGSSGPASAALDVHTAQLVGSIMQQPQLQQLHKGPSGPAALDVRTVQEPDGIQQQQQQQQQQEQAEKVAMEGAAAATCPAALPAADCVGSSQARPSRMLTHAEWQARVAEQWRQQQWPDTVHPTMAATAAVQQQHEARLHHRLHHRLSELQDLPPSTPNDVKMACLLESKQLSLAGMQRSLRARVVEERRALHDVAPDRLMDWRRWRRPAPTPWDAADKAPAEVLVPAAKRARTSYEPVAADNRAFYDETLKMREAEKVEREELRAKLAQAKRLQAFRDWVQQERVRQAEMAAIQQRELEARLRAAEEQRKFLADLMLWAREGFRPAAQQAQRRRAQRNQGVRAWHTKEARRVTREASARVSALRSQNYEEYLRLATHAKDSRLRTLLEKTDAILSDLGHKVVDQRKASSADADGDAAASAPWKHGDVRTEKANRAREAAGEAADEGDEDHSQHHMDPAVHAMLQGQHNYYNNVHVIQEQVTTPNLLQGGTLRSYQLGGLKFLLSLVNNKMNGILADEMGLGKTIMTIGALAALQESKNNKGPHMILAPKAVLSNWQTEFDKWAPGMRVVMYDGTPEERKQLRAEVVDKGGFTVLVTHYDLAIRDKAALKKHHWELLVVDEGHRLKNASSKLAEVLRSFLVKHRVLLTGTPIQNTLGELWALLNFVLPHVFNCSDTFDEWFAAPFQGSSEDVAQQLNEEEQLLVITRLHQVLRPFMLRRTKREVESELPGKTEHVLRCAMSAWQTALYQQITGQGRVMMEDASSKSLQNTAMHLRKACNHPYLFLGTQPYMPKDALEPIRASGKLELLDRILPKLRASGHRVLLFSQMVKALDIIQDYLDFREYRYLRLDGSTKTDDRGRMLKDFNAEGSEIFIFMLSTRAGGLGLNLQTADTVIMFDSDWNPQMDLQAEDRAHRIGQKKDVLVLILVSAGTIEQAILDKAQLKRDLDAKVIQAGMFNDRSTHSERQQVLQKLMQKGTADLGQGVPSDCELNSLLARSKAELVSFAQMDDEAAGLANGKARLMTAEELPSWVTSPPPATNGASAASDLADEVSAETVTGRKRRRTSCASVSYSDVTDAVFLRMLDGTETPVAVPRARSGAAKPPGKRQKSSGGGTPSAKQRPPLVPPAEPKGQRSGSTSQAGTPPNDTSCAQGKPPAQQRSGRPPGKRKAAADSSANPAPSGSSGRHTLAATANGTPKLHRGSPAGSRGRSGRSRSQGSPDIRPHPSASGCESGEETGSEVDGPSRRTPKGKAAS